MLCVESCDATKLSGMLHLHRNTRKCISFTKTKQCQTLTTTKKKEYLHDHEQCAINNRQEKKKITINMKTWSLYIFRLINLTSTENLQLELDKIQLNNKHT